jgi:hypothetical protein
MLIMAYGLCPYMVANAPLPTLCEARDANSVGGNAMKSRGQGGHFLLDLHRT